MPMFIAIETTIYAEVTDQEQGEQACATVESSAMREQLAGFPDGDIIKFDVQRFRKVERAEAEEKGLTEE